MTAETELPAYLPYPRFLLKMDISHTAKLLYALLLDRSTLSQKNGCDCQRAARKEREAAEKQRSHLETVERLKRQGFTDKTMQDWTFANDNGSCPQMKNAAGYVARWERIKDGNYGLLLWGKVGTGKSYFAGCIANALMEQEVPVCMTNFATILNDLAASFAGRNEYISRLCSFPLLCCGSLWRKSLSMKALPLTENAGASYADRKSKSIILLSAR